MRRNYPSGRPDLLNSGRYYAVNADDDDRRYYEGNEKEDTRPYPLVGNDAPFRPSSLPRGDNPFASSSTSSYSFRNSSQNRGHLSNFDDNSQVMSQNAPFPRPNARESLFNRNSGVPSSSRTAVSRQAVVTRIAPSLQRNIEASTQQRSAPSIITSNFKTQQRQQSASSRMSGSTFSPSSFSSSSTSLVSSAPGSRHRSKISQVPTFPAENRDWEVLVGCVLALSARNGHGYEVRHCTGVSNTVETILLPWAMNDPTTQFFLERPIAVGFGPQNVIAPLRKPTNSSRSRAITKGSASSAFSASSSSSRLAIQRKDQARTGTGAAGGPRQIRIAPSTANVAYRGTRLHVACLKGNSARVIRLLECLPTSEAYLRSLLPRYVDQSSTPAGGLAYAIETLLYDPPYVDVNVRDTNDATPLMSVLRVMRDQMIRPEQGIDILYSFLSLARGQVDVNSTYSDDPRKSLNPGDSVLHTAVAIPLEAGGEEAVSILLRYGREKRSRRAVESSNEAKVEPVNTNCPNLCMETPLHRLVSGRGVPSAEPKYVDPLLRLLELFLEAGTDFNATFEEPVGMHGRTVTRRPLDCLIDRLLSAPIGVPGWPYTEQPDWRRVFDFLLYDCKANPSICGEEARVWLRKAGLYTGR